MLGGVGADYYKDAEELNPRLSEWLREYTFNHHHQFLGYLAPIEYIEKQLGFAYLTGEGVNKPGAGVTKRLLLIVRYLPLKNGSRFSKNDFNPSWKSSVLVQSCCP